MLALGSVEIAFVATAAVGAVGLAIIYWRYASRRRAASERLQQYKEQVVSYSDAMDRIQERHKMLPFTDPDFTSPMVGETLAAYQGVEQAFQRHRDRWLKLMDVWDQAQKLIESEGITTNNSEKVKQLLEATKVADEIAALNQECNAELDRLERAHERVDLLLESNQSRLSEAKTRLDAIGEYSLPLHPFDEALGEIQSRTDAAAALRAADPLNAALELQQAEQTLSHLSERVTGVLEQRKRADEVAQRSQEITDMAQRRRAEGLRFVEEQGNPDPLLAEAAESQKASMAVLQQADDQAARRRLDNAAALLDEAEEAIKFQVDFRDHGADRIRALQSTLRDLGDGIEAAKRARGQLERRHSRDAWVLVQDNPDQACELATSMGDLLTEAATESTPDRQHYYRAQQLVREVEIQLPDAQSMVAAVSTRLDELNALAERCARWASDLDAEARRLENVLRSNTADRHRSNLRFEQAAQALVQVLESSQQGLPNWPHIERDLDRVDRDLQATDEMVREDLRLAQQAKAEIREAGGQVRRCQGFYEMGVSANVGHAAGDLREAERALERQEYERAIQLANGAETSARQALDAARSEAERREREARRRRNQEAAMQMAQVLATAAAQAAILNSQRRRR